MTKYELTDETITTVEAGVWVQKESTLYRIRALENFGDVRAGDLGGFVQSENNLSHEGKAWIGDDACICENARIFGNAIVSDRAKVSGNAQIYGDSQVSGTVEIWDDVRVYDQSRVFESARLFSEAKVYGSSQVFGEARMCGSSSIYGNAILFERAKLGGNAGAFHNAVIGGRVAVDNQALVGENAEIGGSVFIDFVGRFMTAAKVFSESDFFHFRAPTPSLPKHVTIYRTNFGARCITNDFEGNFEEMKVHLESMGAKKELLACFFEAAAIHFGFEEIAQVNSNQKRRVRG